MSKYVWGSKFAFSVFSVSKNGNVIITTVMNDLIKS